MNNSQFNVLLLSGGDHHQIQKYLCACGDQVIEFQEKISLDSKFLKDVDFIVSYGYRHIIKKDVLNEFPNKAINIHISYLPWNKGADPNLWSFLENTPKGVTIHYTHEGVDTGDILVQEEIHMETNETLKTSYEKLCRTAESLFEKWWLDIRDARVIPTCQPDGGTNHKMLDRKFYEHLLTQGWDTPVSSLIGKATPPD